MVDSNMAARILTNQCSPTCIIADLFKQVSSSFQYIVLKYNDESLHYFSMETNKSPLFSLTLFFRCLYWHLIILLRFTLPFLIKNQVICIALYSIDLVFDQVFQLKLGWFVLIRVHLALYFDLFQLSSWY